MNLPMCFDIPDHILRSPRCRTMPCWIFSWSKIVHDSISKLNETREDRKMDSSIEEVRVNTSQIETSLMVIGRLNQAILSSSSSPVSTAYRARSPLWTHLSSSLERSSNFFSQASTTIRLVRVSPTRRYFRTCTPVQKHDTTRLFRSFLNTCL